MGYGALRETLTNQHGIRIWVLDCNRVKPIFHCDVKSFALGPGVG